MNTSIRNSQQSASGRLWHGAAYYPELWPELSIKSEMKLMLEAGLSVIRIGEFAWSHMEPNPDVYNFDLFLEVMDTAHSLGLHVVFGTPTATPPIWLTHGHPERVLHDSDGRPMSHGGRQHLAIDEPYVRERCSAIVENLARAIGDNPSLLAWQIDNEFKCDVDGDYGPSVKPAWIEWLRQWYGDIDNLNKAWGTGVWSQHYQDFHQVPFPVKCPGLHNASLLTAWRRFSRDRIADFAEMQTSIIRQYSKVPITHNAGMLFRSNAEKIMESMDFVSFDHYADYSNWYRMVLNYDYWRNLKKERWFWLMETSSGHNGSLQGFHKPHPPGFVKAEAIANFALGGTAFCYWVWRQQRTGAELTHGCLMQAWDSPSMGMKNAHEVELARKDIEPKLKGRQLAMAEIALSWSDNARIMIETEPHNDLKYTTLLERWAKWIREAGYHMDVIPDSDSLSERKIVFTPFMPAVPATMLNTITKFVRNGGIWIAGPLTGGRTWEHTVPTEAGLGSIEKLAGIKTLHSYPLNQSNARGCALGLEVELTGWSYLFESNGAKIIGTVKGGPTPDLGFLSEYSLGKGKVVILGSEPCGEEAPAFIKMLLNHYAEQADVQFRYDVSAGTIVAPWSNESSQLLVVVNMDGKGGSLKLPANVRDESGRTIPADNPITIPEYDYRLLTLNSGKPTTPLTVLSSQQ